MFGRKFGPFPFIKMRDMTECGTTCLAMIFKYYGLFNVQAALREITNVTSTGTDLLLLSKVAERFGFDAVGMRVKFDDLPKVTAPLIAHYEGNHFVVLVKAKKDSVVIADPAYGKDTVSKEEFCKKWNGIVLELTPTRDVFKNNDVMEVIEKYKKKQAFVSRTFYLSLLFPFKRVLWEIILSSIVLQALALALPFFTQTILDSVLVFQNKNLLFAILVGMVGIFLLQILLTYSRHLLFAQFKVLFELEFFSNLFKKFLQLHQSYFDAHKREDFINRFQENLKIRNAFSAGTVEGVLDIILLFTLLPVLFVFHPVLALIAVSFLFLYISITILFSPRIKRLQEKIFYENTKTMGSVLDTLLGMQTVKLLGVETLKYWEWRRTYKHALNKVLQANSSQTLMQTTLSTVSALGRIGVYWFGAWVTFNNEITIGEYVAFISIFGIMTATVASVTNLWFMLMELSVTFARLNDIFAQETEQTDLSEHISTMPDCTVDIQNVWFSYGNGDHFALKDISLTIKPGEHIGIVGRNGSGKTTLTKLLVRLYDTYKGSIHIGGVELRNYYPQFLRKRIMTVPQEVYLFSGTIADNIRVANPQASIDDVVRAAKLADLHDFVGSLYLGYNHKIGESGSNLSGGQRLKIAFARLFLSNPDIIILDEASSALDVLAEQTIMRNLYQHFQGKTVIAIAHRLSTLQHVHKIVVLNEGAIAEQGTHGELLDKQGVYYQFIKTYVDY